MNKRRRMKIWCWVACGGVPTIATRVACVGLWLITMSPISIGSHRLICTHSFKIRYHSVIAITIHCCTFCTTTSPNPSPSIVLHWAAMMLLRCGSRLRAGVDSLRCGRIEPIRSAVQNHDVKHVEDDLAEEESTMMNTTWTIEREERTSCQCRDKSGREEIRNSRSRCCRWLAELRRLQLLAADSQLAVAVNRAHSQWGSGPVRHRYAAGQAGLQSVGTATLCCRRARDATHQAAGGRNSPAAPAGVQHGAFCE
ncbi:hypothetical protein Taro_035308 [Colocasia esculenta]|uniref:Uncharacterized protein n=1 Tax=Colocasia esculenta TaxID=4460 RepID=A0A843W6B0_COLES|nr:hypothetical protein [Colocasia esculenta]